MAHARPRAGRRAHPQPRANSPDARSERNPIRASDLGRLHWQLRHPLKRYLPGQSQHVQRLQILLQRRSAQFGCGQADLGKRWLHTSAVAKFALSVPCILWPPSPRAWSSRPDEADRLCHRSAAGSLARSALRISIACSMCPSSSCSDCGKGLAETARSGFPDACVACDGERFEHDLLNDEAANEVALCDASA